jgi:type I restriction-modification system DNA methylase subunit
MAEPTLTPLFHPQHVQAIADRLGHANWDVLQSESFRAGLEDIERRRLTGEANTREKIIEPILYGVLGFDRNENDAEHAVSHAGAGGGTGAVEYYFLILGNPVPLEAKSWGKPLDERDSSGRSPVRQGFEYAVLSSLRWFIVTNGEEWRLYKTQLKGSQSPLGACERYLLKDLMENRKTFLRFYATFSRGAFVPSRDGVSRLDEFRQQSEQWQQEIGDTLYKKLVEARLRLYREIQPQFADLAQEDMNDAVVKLLFRIMFILFAEHTPLLPKDFLSREVMQRFENDQKWGVSASLYGYVQQYFAWLDGRAQTRFDVYPYDGELFDPDPVLDAPALKIDDKLFCGLLKQLSRDGFGRTIDYSQINPRVLGNIYEQFLGYVIEIKEGRLDPQAGRDTRRKQGSFYTPESVTRYIVEESVGRAMALCPDRKPWELRCLDPACGSGHFLVEYVNHVARLSEELDDSRTYPAWKRYITEHCVFGVDKDRTATMLTKLSLWINSAMKDEPFATIDTHIKCGNSLVFGTPAGFRLAGYEKQTYPKKHRELVRLRKELVRLEDRAAENRPLLGGVEARELHRDIRRALARLQDAKIPIARELSERLRERSPDLATEGAFHWEVEFAEVFEDREGFDIVVGNPPWGADLASIRGYLEGGEFQLARGQYDSYELFIELGRRLMHDWGAFGFIVPDSITLPEHEPLRRMLLENTTLTRLVRAGEGLFPGVFRAAFFLCFVNRPAEPDHHVRVATLRKEHRKQLESDTLFDPVRTVAEVVEETGHSRAQTEFTRNPRADFDILGEGADAPIVVRIDAPSLDWTAIAQKGRGVEIGKSGDVIQCPYCYRWDNVPRKSKGKWPPKVCRHCGREFSLENAAKREQIIAERARGKNWKPIIPGQSVNRYAIGPEQYIDAAKDGINYKSPEFYEGKRLLLRQTGVGIYATIDSSGTLTNQSVFTWRLRNNLKKPLTRYRLEYVLGVLNSRLMLYRYYMRSGDTEWRSFPRWTQELVQDLPIRAIDFGDRRQAKLHDEIADRVAAVIAAGKPPTNHEDYEIEKRVMQVYGITRSMCRRVFEVLHQVQKLRVVREMNIAEPDMLLDALPE